MAIFTGDFLGRLTMAPNQAAFLMCVPCPVVGALNPTHDPRPVLPFSLQLPIDSGRHSVLPAILYPAYDQQCREQVRAGAAGESQAVEHPDTYLLEAS